MTPQHKKECAKNNTSCAVYHPDGVCPGYDQYVACTCNQMPTIPPKPPSGEKKCLECGAECVKDEESDSTKVPDSEVSGVEEIDKFIEEFVKISPEVWQAQKDWLRTALQSVYQQGRQEALKEVMECLENELKDVCSAGDESGFVEGYFKAITEMREEIEKIK